MPKNYPPDLICVYNCCGASGRADVERYERHIWSLLKQVEAPFSLVISSCQNSHADLMRLNEAFGKQVSWSITQCQHTVNVTFNQACRSALIEFGMPKLGFLYVDSGITFAGDTFKLKRLIEAHSKTNGMTAALTDTDTGLDLWAPAASIFDLFRDGKTYTIPIGSTCNLHCQIFDSELVEAFGHPLPDVFRDYCTESIFSFMCAAIGKRFQMTKTATVHHEHAMDGGASCFPGARGWSNFLPEAPRTAAQIITDPEALACGMGYEECEGILKHDPTLYDTDGMVANPTRLKNFIQNNFFLPPSYYAFEPMDYVWIPRGKDMNNYQLPKEPFVPNVQEIANRKDVGAWLNRHGMGKTFIQVPWGTTPAASAGHADYSIDGVFLAIEHHYGLMLETLDAWWPKVKRLGLVAGADFNHKGFKFSPANVDPRNAVERWADEHHVTVHVCQDGTFAILKRW